MFFVRSWFLVFIFLRFLFLFWFYRSVACSCSIPLPPFPYCCSVYYYFVCILLGVFLEYLFLAFGSSLPVVSCVCCYMCGCSSCVCGCILISTSGTSSCFCPCFIAQWPFGIFSRFFWLSWSVSYVVVILYLLFYLFPGQACCFPVLFVLPFLLLLLFYLVCFLFLVFRVVSALWLFLLLFHMCFLGGDCSS